LVKKVAPAILANHMAQKNKTKQISITSPRCEYNIIDGNWRLLWFCFVLLVKKTRATFLTNQKLK